MSDWPFTGLIPLKYGVILADCPWQTVMRSDKGYEKSPEKHYETMSEAELCALPVSHLASRDCVLVMWGRWMNLEEVLRVGAAWGFTYKTGGSWQKRTKTGKKTFGTGYIYRNSTEPYLVFTTGKPSYKSRSVRDSITTDEIIDPALSFPSDIDALRREHSRKPTEMRANIDLMFPHQFGCELFAREPWAGRDVWGNEADKFSQALA
jgi:N6-adenosine-specific RNA methylase IME4